MKQSFRIILLNVCMAAIIGMSACKKETSSSTEENNNAIQAAVTATQSVAVATSSSGDSIYIVGTCPPHGKRDSITASALPASITTYLSTNYSGYTFNKAFKVSDASGVVQGYVVVISYNGNPVGLKFDASGNFVKVLEQREGRDLLGNGFRKGGCFENRDGKQRDSLALSALPAAIKNYYAANYPSDTLVRAGRNRDSSYIVISKNNGLFATVFDASGNFVSRIELPAPKGKITAIEASALPAQVVTYLTNTYPGYVLQKAFSVSGANGIVAYCVAIEANSTKYGLLFDASGNFIAVKTIR